MSSAALCLAWTLSVLPLALGAFAPELYDPEGGSRLALALLPWLALSGLPGRAPERPAHEASPSGVMRPTGRALSTLGWMLPPLLLAARLDRADGAEWAASARVLAPGLTFCALLAWSSARARGNEWHALGWLLLLPALPLLVAALTWASAPGAGEVPAALLRLAEQSPLRWCLDLADGTGTAAAVTWHAVPLGPLALVLVVSALAARPGRRAGTGSSGSTDSSGPSGREVEA